MLKFINTHFDLFQYDSFKYIYLKYLTLFPNIFPTFAIFTMLDTSTLKIFYWDLISPRELCPFHFQSSFVLTILCLSSSALTKSWTSVSCHLSICSLLQVSLIYIFLFSKFCDYFYTSLKVPLCLIKCWKKSMKHKYQEFIAHFPTCNMGTGYDLFHWAVLKTKFVGMKKT